MSLSLSLLLSFSSLPLSHSHTHMTHARTHTRTHTETIIGSRMSLLSLLTDFKLEPHPHYVQVWINHSCVSPVHTVHVHSIIASEASFLVCSMHGFSICLYIYISGRTSCRKCSKCFSPDACILLVILLSDIQLL